MEERRCGKRKKLVQSDHNPTSPSSHNSQRLTGREAGNRGVKLSLERKRNSKECCFDFCICFSPFKYFLTGKKQIKFPQVDSVLQVKVIGKSSPCFYPQPSAFSSHFLTLTCWEVGVGDCWKVTWLSVKLTHHRQEVTALKSLSEQRRAHNVGLCLFRELLTSKWDWCKYKTFHSWINSLAMWFLWKVFQVVLAMFLDS